MHTTPGVGIFTESLYVWSPAVVADTICVYYSERYFMEYLEDTAK